MSTEAGEAHLVDTGADVSVLALRLSRSWGHLPDDLRQVDASQIEGFVAAWRATSPLRAALEILQEAAFDLDPLFLETPYVLWGRGDFMRAWDVLVSEARRRFELSPS